MTQLIVRASDILCRCRAAKFGRNLVKYMSVQHIWNFSQLLGLFTCRKRVNLSWNFITETCKQHPETTRHRLCCEKLGTSHWLCHWFQLLKEQIMTSVRKTLKTLLWSVQNRSISNKVFPENNQKIGLFLPINFRLSLPRKFPRNWSIFPQKIAPKNPVKLGFFSETYQTPCIVWCNPVSINLEVNWFCLCDLAHFLR